MLQRQKLSAAFAAAEATSMFNSSEWKPVPMMDEKGNILKDEEGNTLYEVHDLKTIWEQQHPGWYEEITGEIAPVTARSFENGVGKRITITFKNGSTTDLKLSGKSDLDEGDFVKIPTIKGTLLRKLGMNDIIRYDAEIAEDEE